MLLKRQSQNIILGIDGEFYAQASVLQRFIKICFSYFFPKTTFRFSKNAIKENYLSVKDESISSIASDII